MKRKRFYGSASPRQDRLLTFFTFFQASSSGGALRDCHHPYLPTWLSHKFATSQSLTSVNGLPGLPWVDSPRVRQPYYECGPTAPRRPLRSSPRTKDNLRYPHLGDGTHEIVSQELAGSASTRPARGLFRR